MEAKARMRSKEAREFILKNQTEVLQFLKTQFPLYHLSNFFFRDLQFGIQQMLERKKGWKVGYKEAEQTAALFAEQLERLGIFKRIDQQSWVVNYPAFKTPVVKPPSAAARPAGPAPAARPAPKPAAAAAPKPVAAAAAPAAPAGTDAPPQRNEPSQ